MQPRRDKIQEILSSAAVNCNLQKNVIEQQKRLYSTYAQLCHYKMQETALAMSSITRQMQLCWHFKKKMREKNQCRLQPYSIIIEVKTDCRGMEMFIYSRTCSKHIWILWLWLWKPLVFHNDSNHRAKNSGLVRIYNLIINSGRIFQNNETDLFVEKPLTAMVFWRKPLTIPSCSKFNHCCGLMCAKYKQVRYPWQEL